MQQTVCTTLIHGMGTAMINRVKIITALWGDKYSVEDIEKLGVDIDIVFSDREIPGYRTIPLDMSWKGTWKKMQVFDSRHEIGQCLFLDLDVEVKKNLLPLTRHFRNRHTPQEVTCTHVHWYDNENMERDKSTYISCNVNTGIFAFNNSYTDHIYQETVKWRHKLEMLFEGTDKWWFHRHKDWYNFFPDAWIQHANKEYDEHDYDEAIVISHNGSAYGRNKIKT